MEKEELLGLVGPYTILSEGRKNALYNCASHTISKEILGDFVECGVFNGGSAGILGSILLDSKIPRKIWLFDSFEGLPNPTEEDIDSHGEKGKKGQFSDLYQKLRSYFLKRLVLNKIKLKSLKGGMKVQSQVLM